LSGAAQIPIWVAQALPTYILAPGIVILAVG